MGALTLTLTLMMVMVKISQQQAGVTPVLSAGNCQQVLDAGHTSTGVYLITLDGSPKQVYCRIGWTYIQRRHETEHDLHCDDDGDDDDDEDDDHIDFNRGFLEYKNGFGNAAGEHFLGLDNIHALIGNSLTEIVFILENDSGDIRYAKYDYFWVGDSTTGYKLYLGPYNTFVSNAGDALSVVNGMPFSAIDVDLDNLVGIDCAGIYKAGFWYGSTDPGPMPSIHDCGMANPNGHCCEQDDDDDDDDDDDLPHVGIIWEPFSGWNGCLKSVEILIKHVS